MIQTVAEGPEQMWVRRKGVFWRRLMTKQIFDNSRNFLIKPCIYDRKKTETSIQNVSLQNLHLDTDSLHW